ncbi:hypothetical protein SNK04_004021 [Fusarium graminearum]
MRQKLIINLQDVVAHFVAHGEVLQSADYCLGLGNVLDVLKSSERLTHVNGDKNCSRFEDSHPCNCNELGFLTAGHHCIAFGNASGNQLLGQLVRRDCNFRIGQFTIPSVHCNLIRLLHCHVVELVVNALINVFWRTGTPMLNLSLVRIGQKI